MLKRETRWGLLLGFMLLALTACDDAEDTIDGGPEAISIIGNWVDENAATYAISATEWRQTFGEDVSTFAILTFDEASMFIVAENDADNAFNPGKFSRFDWTQMGDRLFFCQSAFDAETAEAAANIESADSSDPTTGGCGGMFPWTELLSL